MMDVVARGVEANIKAHENCLGGREPFGKTASVVFSKARFDPEATFSANRVDAGREAEGFLFGGVLFIPARS